MAIKIVGQDPAAVKRCTCGKCAAVLEYTLSDTTTGKHHDYGGGCDTYRYLKCPACGNEINLGYA